MGAGTNSPRAIPSGRGGLSSAGHISDEEGQRVRGAFNTSPPILGVPEGSSSDRLGPHPVAVHKERAVPLPRLLADGGPQRWTDQGGDAGRTRLRRTCRGPSSRADACPGAGTCVQACPPATGHHEPFVAAALSFSRASVPAVGTTAQGGGWTEGPRANVTFEGSNLQPLQRKQERAAVGGPPSGGHMPRTAAEAAPTGLRSVR